MKVQIDQTLLREIVDLAWRIKNGGELSFKDRDSIERLDKLVAEIEQQHSEQERKFWRLVDLINWESRPDIHKVKRMLMTQFSRHDVKAFSDWVSEKEGVMYDILDGVVTGVGDDGYGDICSEIVGRGKEFFTAVLNDPQKAVNLDYHEKFYYCLPYEHDYEWLRPEGVHKIIIDRFWARSSYYDPRNWDVDDDKVTDCINFYLDMLKIDENTDPIARLKELNEVYNFDELYNVSYSHHIYGFGNFVRDVQRYVLDN